MKQQRSVIDDVAKLAGVSRSTVSRVTSNSARVDASTRKKVEAAIAQLGYVPAERKLRSRITSGSRVRCSRIAFLVPDVLEIAARTRITSSLAHGIADVLQRDNIEMLFCKLDHNGELPSTVTNGQIDGIICKNWPKSTAVIEAVSRMPHVWCLASPVKPRIGDQVYCDNQILAQIVVDYFKSRNVNKVYFCGGNTIELSQRSRREHISDQAAKHGLELEFVEDYLNFFPSPSNGKYAILLEDAEVNFYHFYLQMLHHEIDVKRDCIILPLNISREQLAGIDDSIDMIELNHDELGRAAAELLIWRLANPTAPCRRVMIAPELIEGKHSPAE